MAKEESDTFRFEGKKNKSLFSAHQGEGKVVVLKWATSALEYFDRL